MDVFMYLLYDSEKWASDYVEVRGNFQFPELEHGHFEIATRRGTPNTTKINKILLRAARGCGLADSLLTIPAEERDAPTILRYKATYGGRIRRKVTDEREQASEVGSEDIPEELLPSFDKPLRGTIRLPAEEEPFREQEEMPPRSIKAVLQKRLEEKKKEKAELRKAGAPGASGSMSSKKTPPPPPSKKRPLSAPSSSKDTLASKKTNTLFC
ncbi:uncharacterized protein LOC131315839 [Rhododendron vialii]|uniref:uncharacterized protein LOC131315839 n=1 Tax=Rhododendron vialii TaxID=182163 RepID=UPI00265EC7DC|nr:uncharacterized protein LOC131315839 [Rhododendron vialii]